MHRFCIPRTPWHCKELLGDRGKTWQLADFISVVNLDAMALEEGHVVWPTAAVYDARCASWPRRRFLRLGATGENATGGRNTHAIVYGKYQGWQPGYGSVR